MKEYIDKIVKNGKQEDMDCLEEILVESLHDMKESNYTKFHTYKNKIKGMAYNYEIDEEMAEEIVEEMQPLGEYWDMETIASVIGNDTHKLCDMYVVMNSLVNDYQNVINPESVDTYIKMSHAWLDDVDGKPNKVWWYFVK